MIVHFDGDLLVYRAGFAAERQQWWVIDANGGERGCFPTKREATALADELNEAPDEPDDGFEVVKGDREAEPVEHAIYNARSMLETTCRNLEVDPEQVRVYLSGPTNFRDGIATLKPYKGNRDETHKPIHGPAIKKHLEKYWGATYSEDEEADDVVAYSHYQMWQEDPFSTILASTDKDLDMIPGMHYNFVKEESYTIGIEEAEHNFLKQLLTGDATDNIPGIPRVGPKTAVKMLAEVDDPWEAIEAAYRDAYGDNWYEALVENGRLLWMRRKPHEWWTPPEHVLEDKIPYE